MNSEFSTTALLNILQCVHLDFYAISSLFSYSKGANGTLLLQLELILGFDVEKNVKA